MDAFFMVLFFVVFSVEGVLVQRRRIVFRVGGRHPKLQHLLLGAAAQEDFVKTGLMARGEGELYRLTSRQWQAAALTARSMVPP